MPRQFQRQATVTPTVNPYRGNGDDEDRSEFTGIQTQEPKVIGSQHRPLSTALLTFGTPLAIYKTKRRDGL